MTTTGQNVTLRSAHDHSCQRLLHSPSSNQLSQIRATDLPGWGERDEESTRTRTGTFRRLHGVGIHAYLFGQLFAQCRTAYINTHAALLMVDKLGSIPKGSHCNTSHCIVLAAPCKLCIMRTHGWEKVRLAATRHAVVALELSPWSVEQISNPGHRGPLPRWTARQMEG